MYTCFRPFLQNQCPDTDSPANLFKVVEGTEVMLVGPAPPQDRESWWKIYPHRTQAQHTKRIIYRECIQ